MLTEILGMLSQAIGIMQDDHTEIHEALRLLRTQDRLLAEFAPLLENLRTGARSPLAAALASRKRGRNAVPQDSDGQVQVS